MPATATLRSCLSLVALASMLRGDPPAPTAPPPPALPAVNLAVISDDEARLELARVLVYAGRHDEALAEYRLLIDARPDDHALRAEYGRTLGWAGRSAEAITALAPLPPDALPADTAVLLADLLLGGKKFAEATALYRRALDENPADHAVRFKLAQVLSWQGQHEASLAEFARLLAVSPDDIQVRRHRAQVLGQAGRHAEAATEWRRTLPATP